MGIFEKLLKFNKKKKTAWPAEVLLKRILRNGNLLQYSCLEKSHGQRSIVGYSPWGRKESDTTERLHFHFQA